MELISSAGNPIFTYSEKASHPACLKCNYWVTECNKGGEKLLAVQAFWSNAQKNTDKEKHLNFLDFFKY